MNLGLLIILISFLGCISNWLNAKYLNYWVVRLLYYLGAVVHESSHAFFCLLTGAKITEFKVFSKQPHITHYESRLPILGEPLISLAPILGGLLFLFLINQFFLKSYFVVPQFYDWHGVPSAVLSVLSQIHVLTWQSWLMILIFLNIGAMISPSWQDLKNIWPVIIVLLFLNFAWADYFGLLAVILILANIVIQIFLSLLLAVFKIA